MRIMGDNEFSERFDKLTESMGYLKSMVGHNLIWSTVITDILIAVILEQPEPNKCANSVIKTIKEKVNVKKTP